MTTVHTFTALGQYLAADVNSGAVHVLDKLTYDLLSGAGEGPLGEALPQELADKLSQYDRTELEEGWQELLELQSAGLLFTADDCPRRRWSRPCAFMCPTTATCGASTASPPPATSAPAIG